MVKLSIIQTKAHSTNVKGIERASKLLETLGRKETHIVCLPEQWLQDNKISDFDKEFAIFKKIAKDYAMTIIPGAFYERRKYRFVITCPVIGPEGEIIGRQDKIHPFDYERNLVQPGKTAEVFKTDCRFGIIVCYDMVFPSVANTLVKKGAEVILSPSRIVKRGIIPWHLYVQTRALENRVPILAANVENKKYGGQSLIVDLVENEGVIIPKLFLKNEKEDWISRKFNLSKYHNSRKNRFSDVRSFS